MAPRRGPKGNSPNQGGGQTQNPKNQNPQNHNNNNNNNGNNNNYNGHNNNNGNTNKNKYNTQRRNSQTVIQEPTKHAAFKLSHPQPNPRISPTWERQLGPIILKVLEDHEAQKRQKEVRLEKFDQFALAQAREPVEILTNSLCTDCQSLAYRLIHLEKRFKILSQEKQNFQKAFPSPASTISSPFPLTPRLPEFEMEPFVSRFLGAATQHLNAKNGPQLRNLFHLDLAGLDDDAVGQEFLSLHQELKKEWPKEREPLLEKLCKKAFSKDGGKESIFNFAAFVFKYLRYLRDFGVNSSESTAEAEELVNLSNSALNDASYANVMLSTVLFLSRQLANIVTKYDKNSTAETNASQNRNAPHKATLVEDSANTLRETFIKCLSGGLGQTGRNSRPNPEDKRVGIYLTANSCLKLLFQCHKIRNAQQLFLSIDAQSPLLSFYPAAQRVTYLYYLGRYHFANGHFYRAQLALQSAYDQCHRAALKHRRLILVYLIAANLCLGRMPSSKLLLRREAADIAKKFLPLCEIIKRGDLGAFRQYLDLKNASAQWFRRKSILLQLQSRCEIIVWRCLVRKTFVLIGYKGEDKKIPFLRLTFVQAAARWMMERSKPSNVDQPTNQTLSPFGAPTQRSFFGGPSSQGFGAASSAFGSPFTTTSGAAASAASSPFFSSSSPQTPASAASTSASSSEYTDPDFLGLAAALAETGFDPETGMYHEDNDDDETTDDTRTMDRPVEDHESEPYPTMFEIESIFYSLIQQGLLYGFVTHANPRFAIPGARDRGWDAKGFPLVWQVVKAREESGAGAAVVQDEVPGWVKEMKNSTAGVGAGAGAGASLGGRVVRLTGARPVGMGP